MNPQCRCRQRWLTCLVVMTLCLVMLPEGAIVLAQEEGTDDLVKTARPRRTDTLDYITIDVREKPLREVLQGIGRQVGTNIVADPLIEEFVTIALDAVEWRKALEVIARQTHCTIVHESPRLIRFTQPPPISIEFKEADLKVVLDLLAKQSGANIVVASDVQGSVTLSLRDVPWRDALNTIVKTAGFVTVEDTEGVTNIIRVVRPESLKKQLITKIFRLRYVRPPERYEAIMTDIDKHSVDKHGSEPLDPESEFTVLKALRKALSEDGEMEYDFESNTIIVKDIPTRIAEIADILEKLDLEPVQVQIDVTFVSTTSSDLLETGIKFDLPNTPEREGLKIAAMGAPPNILVTSRENFAGALDPAVEYGGTFPFDLGHWETIRRGINGQGFNALGILDFTQTQLLLSMVRDDDNSKVIQQPRLVTLDNHPSTIFVGESVPFAVQRVKTDQNGNVQVEIDENDRSPINIGFTLYISPHVIPGTDTVHVNVIPKVSSLVGTTSPVEGFDRFSFQQDGTSIVNFIDLPRESAQTVVTYLRVQSGHSGVIGGLHSERKFEIETRVPILSSIPIVGNVFRWKRKAAEVDHLLIIVTPTIIANSEQSDQIYRKAVEEADSYDYFKRKYKDDDDEENEEK